jgi:hypothetical protein
MTFVSNKLFKAGLSKQLFVKPSKKQKMTKNDERRRKEGRKISPSWAKIIKSHKIR